MSGHNENGTTRPRLRHICRRQPPKLSRRILRRHRVAIRAIGGHPDVDLDCREQKRTRIDRIGMLALVVAGSVALLEVRAGDRIERRERG